ncbi:MAG: PAS domain S-box protein, partial [Candidatus Methanofastidiosia archaeon]
MPKKTSPKTKDVLREKIVLLMEEGVLIEDEKGFINFVNPKVVELLGFAESEIVGKHWKEIVPKRFHEIVEKETSKRSKGLKSRYEIYLLTERGEEVPVIVGARPLFGEGEFKGVLSVFTDIRERKRREKELSELKEFSESILENAPIGILTTDEKGDVTSANSALLEILGSPGERETKKFNVLKLPQLKKVGMDKLFSKVLFEKERIDVETEYISFWGKKSHARVKSIPLLDSKGRVNGLVALVEDITERKRLERKLKSYTEELERKIEDKTRRIKALLETDYALRETSNWEKGLEIIIDGALKGLGFDTIGIYLLNQRKNLLEYVKGFETLKDYTPENIPLSDEDYVASKCIKERKPFNIKDAFSDLRVQKQIEPISKEFAWIPILFQDDLLGAMVVSNRLSEREITEEDIQTLMLFANQTATFIEKARIQIEPAVESHLETELTYKLEPSEGYLVKEVRPEKSFEIFYDLVTHGIPGFCVSRTHPEKIIKVYGLKKTPIVWLS